jgi:hypothetical protein
LDSQREISSKITTPDGPVQYAFDADGQLLSAIYSPLPLGDGRGEGATQPNETYTYDSNGNRTNPGYIIESIRGTHT